MVESSGRRRLPGASPSLRMRPGTGRLFGLRPGGERRGGLGYKTASEGRGADGLPRRVRLHRKHTRVGTAHRSPCQVRRSVGGAHPTNGHESGRFGMSRGVEGEFGDGPLPDASGCPRGFFGSMLDARGRAERAPRAGTVASGSPALAPAASRHGPRPEVCTGMARGGDSLPHRGRCATPLRQMSQNVPDVPLLSFFGTLGTGSEAGHRRPTPREMSQTSQLPRIRARIRGRPQTPRSPGDVPRCPKMSQLPRIGSRIRGRPSTPRRPGSRPPRRRRRGRSAGPGRPGPAAPPTLRRAAPCWESTRGGGGTGRDRGRGAPGDGGAGGGDATIDPGRGPRATSEPIPVPFAGASSHTFWERNVFG